MHSIFSVMGLQGHFQVNLKIHSKIIYHIAKKTKKITKYNV